MRLYIYLDRELIKRLAAKIPNVKFDIDFFEYSEKRAYSVNNNACVRPETEKKEKDKSCYRTRVGMSAEQGELSTIEVIKRYINIEDVSSIKNNKFYYNIIESIPEDDRVVKSSGRILSIEDNHFFMQNDKYLFDLDEKNKLVEAVENECDVVALGYKINCLNSEYNTYKTIAVYIE